MRERIKSGVMIAVVFAMFFLAAGHIVGCDSVIGPIFHPTTQPISNIDRVDNMRKDYTSTLHFMIQARQLGKISDAQYVKIEKTRKEASDALDLLEATASSGGSLSQSALDQAQIFLDAYIASKAGVK